MLMRKYEMPWRRAYELYAGVSWWACATYFSVKTAHSQIPFAVCGPLILFCMVIGLHRLGQAMKILTIRASLTGRAMQVINSDQLKSICSNPDQVYLGRGFEWQPVHSQRLYELSKINYKDYAINPFVLRLLGYTANPQPDGEIGMPYIHGVEPRETPLFRPLQNFEGGTCIVGTTQAGKGVVLTNLISQAIYRGDVVIILDPKNSKRMRKVVELACKQWREKDTFLFFHPAFPEEGIRFDPLYNWQKPTEIASRIKSIMPVGADESFQSFGWDAVNVVVQGQIGLEDRPNLLKIGRAIENGIEPVLEASLIQHYERVLGSGWRERQDIREMLTQARRRDLKSPSERTTTELLAYVSYYEQRLPESEHTKEIDSQVRVFRHNREHYSKITANLLPILSMLTSGDLGRSISPDPYAEDARPIMNLEKVVRGGHVLYFCLDSLPDSAVASAIAGIVLADCAAYTGMQYNTGEYRRISLFVDEIANCINVPLVELLNKGAEAGVYSTCAMQTFADLAEKLGSEEAARKALGNLNNLIALRSKDRPTQDWIVETFGRTGIHNMKVGVNYGTDGNVGDYSSGVSSQVTEEMNDVIPAEMLGKLPNLQAFCSVSGGRLNKTRFQIINPVEHPPRQQ